MSEKHKIMTLHPAGKKGVKIDLAKYEQIKSFLLDVIEDAKQISFQELSEVALESLKDTFDGKVLWYVVTVKLDLEARNLIERVPKTSPHELRLVK